MAKLKCGGIKQKVNTSALSTAVKTAGRRPHEEGASSSTLNPLNSKQMLLHVIATPVALELLRRRRLYRASTIRICYLKRLTVIDCRQAGPSSVFQPGGLVSTSHLNAMRLPERRPVNING